MEWYGSVSRGVCVVLGAVGLGAASLMVPREELVVLGLLVLVVGVTAAVGYESGDGESPRYTRSKTVLLAVAGCSALAAVLGLATVLGVAVLWLVALLGAVSPPAVRWYWRTTGAVLPAGRRHDAPVRTTAELCRQWHDSYDALQQAKTPVARLRIVMERNQCLDELERRDPEGLNAWLGSTASAAGDPSPFLHHTESGPAADT